VFLKRAGSAQKLVAHPEQKFWYRPGPGKNLSWRCSCS